MRIEVTGDESISKQARTYAEYRVFAALTHAAAARNVDHARVVLRRIARKGECDNVACTVTFAMNGSGSRRIRTIGDHAYAAINRAIERIAALPPPRATAPIPS